MKELKNICIGSIELHVARSLYLESMIIIYLEFFVLSYFFFFSDYDLCVDVFQSGHQFLMAQGQSCKDRCNKSKDSMNVCSCDEMCYIYGDCCLDYEPICRDEVLNFTHRFQEQMVERMDCRPINHDSIMAVSRCPENNDHQEAREFCEEINEFDPRTNLIQAVPYVKDHIVYVNIYCAICSGVASWADFESLDDFVMADCVSASPSDLMSSILTSKNPDDYFTRVRGHCQLKSKAIPSSVRYCEPSPFYPPGNNFQLHSFYSLCLSYSAKVKHSKVIYPNFHCALLDKPNETASDVFKCFSGKEDMPSHDLPFVSFSMLLDLNRSPPPSTSLKAEEDEICPEKFTWSPAIQLCRSPQLCAISRSADCWDSLVFLQFLEDKAEMGNDKTYSLPLLKRLKNLLILKRAYTMSLTALS